MRKLYSIKGEDDELCYPLDYFQELLKEDDHRTSYELEVWVPKLGTGTFWCSDLGEGFESGPGTCGALECSSYDPRNGKSGRCRYHSTPFHPTGKTITITK